ncbi:GntR family transcriptional regulator, partial [Acidianus sp. RZ1]|uniref:GntR family transcriptional regulator n=1 Tax=Acidianus sp. RZ1 TaxID=1540082 RepID=UPI001491C9B6
MNENYREKLSDNVYANLKRDIVTGKFRTNDRLTESDLTKTYGASRTPIREALKKLEKEGLVIRGPDGYRVLYLSKDEVIQLYEIRTRLEALAAERAAMGNRDRLKDLETILEEIKEKTYSDEDPVNLAELNGKLHMIIAEMSGNKFLIQCLQDIRNRLTTVRVTLFAVQGRREMEMKEHEALVEAIKDGDPKRASDLMFEHEK